MVRFKNELGINAVRFHVRVNQHIKVTGLDKNKAFDEAVNWLDVMLDECKRLGIVAVINYGQFPLGSLDNNYMSSSEFWSDQSHLDEIILITSRLAKHFHDRGKELAAYDVISEPLMMIGGKAVAPPVWPDLLGRIVATINRDDPVRWVVVAPGPGGGPAGYEEFAHPGGAKVVLGLHMYLPHAFTHQGIDGRPTGKEYPGRVGLTYWDKKTLLGKMAPLVRYQQRYPAPVFVGEFSAVRWAAGGEQYIRDLTSIFDEYGWGWTYYSGTGWHGWNPDYGSEYGGGQMPKQVEGEKSRRWDTLREIFNPRKE